MPGNRQDHDVSTPRSLAPRGSRNRELVNRSPALENVWGWDRVKKFQERSLVTLPPGVLLKLFGSRVIPCYSSFFFFFRESEREREKDESEARSNSSFEVSLGINSRLFFLLQEQRCDPTLLVGKRSANGECKWRFIFLSFFFSFSLLLPNSYSRRTFSLEQ